MPHHLARENKRYSFSPSHPPVLTIQPGETVVVETNDARSGTIRASTDLLDKPHPLGANPVTGPIRIAGAEPGDSLIVHVRDIALDGHGFTAIKANIGLLGDRASQYATKILSVDGGSIRFSDAIRFPISPMIGVIGVAPEHGEIATLFPGVHGGNMDNKFVRPGCSLHLPVYVPGATFSLGDVHAAMGDGEVTMTGLEIPSKSVSRGASLCSPTTRVPKPSTMSVQPILSASKTSTACRSTTFRTALNSPECGRFRDRKKESSANY